MAWRRDRGEDLLPRCAGEASHSPGGGRDENLSVHLSTETGQLHTHATQLLQNGANVKLVQDRLGHSSSRVTLDVYAQVMAEDRDGVADLLDRLHRKEA